MMKDEVLDGLARTFNVAQFISFDPGQPLRPRYARLRALPPGDALRDPERAVESLLGGSAAGTVNVRTFRPESTKGNPFHYGLASVDEVLALVGSFAEEGFHVIVNETVDVEDGGVSGVRAGGVTEFAPGGTPRIVEEEDVCSLDDGTADALLDLVYGVRLPFPRDPDLRIEFSVHPTPVGHRRQRWIVWEVERVPGQRLAPRLRWPNRFSRLVGDKAFGLMMAGIAGLPVPRTLVLARRVAPFSFGTSTGSGDVWLRTCPVEFSAGEFPTVHGWTDPFRMLAESDPSGDRLASVLVQEGVAARWSGAAVSAADRPVVEGVAGIGDQFMLGLQGPAELPPDIEGDVRVMLRTAEARFGPLRAEWVADTERAWIVQLNQQQRAATVTIEPGEPDVWLRYDPAVGLDALRALVREAMASGAGIEVIRAVGLTSHVGDVLRAARVPSRIGSGPAPPRGSD